MESQKEIDTEISTIKSYLNERLSSDDQILSRLPGIVSQLVTEPESSEDEKSIEQWCNAIISFRNGEIKARVDAVYLNSLSDHDANDHSRTSDEELKKQKAALQAEMEELYSEIASVAEMVVEHELRKPMNEMKERKDREVTQARGAWLNYVRLKPACYYLTNMPRCFQHLITWASASTLSRPIRKMSTSSNRHLHSSMAQQRSAYQIHTLHDPRHLGEGLLRVHLWPLHPWSS